VNNCGVPAHFFNCAFALLPIRFLRQPDHGLQAKPWQRNG
jgi:hypothetical protein